MGGAVPSQKLGVRPSLLRTMGRRRQEEDEVALLRRAATRMMRFSCPTRVTRLDPAAAAVAVGRRLRFGLCSKRPIAYRKNCLLLISVD